MASGVAVGGGSGKSVGAGVGSEREMLEHAARVITARMSRMGRRNAISEAIITQVKRLKLKAKMKAK